MNRFDKPENGQSWLGIATDEESLETLLNNSDLAIVLLDRPATIGHAVVIDGRTSTGMVKILDPFDQTAYNITLDDLIDHWGGEVIFRWQAGKK